MERQSAGHRHEESKTWEKSKSRMQLNCVFVCLCHDGKHRVLISRKLPLHRSGCLVGHMGLNVSLDCQPSGWEPDTAVGALLGRCATA